ncbi:MAG: serine/threonine-protein phosphatase [Dehalococcoidia bacterium]|nr:serine/threonine-protein phosphatase [Dehalococcoidia bacterium]
MTVTWASLTDTGQVRTENQDRALALALPGGAVLLLVADGVGGAPGGALASEEAMRVVREVFEEFAGSAPYAGLLLTAVNLANERIRLVQEQKPEFGNMATTLVAAVVEGAAANLVNIGDSRAYLFHMGQLVQVTEDDSWVAGEVRAGRLSPADADTHPWRNVITRGIGVDEVAEPTPTTLSLGPGDALLLCTDGLFKMVSSEDTARTLATAADAGDAARALVELANARGGLDNIGVALWMGEPLSTQVTLR